MDETTSQAVQTIVTQTVLTVLFMIFLFLSFRKCARESLFHISIYTVGVGGLGVLLRPYLDSVVLLIGIFSILTLAVAILTRSQLESLFERKIPKRTQDALAIALLATVIPCAGLESAAILLNKAGIINVFVPVKTVSKIPGTEDWRMTHITSDLRREPDPVFLWRPKASFPYNSQRHKGPIVILPKPKNTFRIITYGDSNTDGPDTGSWPVQLNTIAQTKPLGSKRIEVINSGVAGFSSYQGLLRFKQELGTYQPDLVLVSFGWNDLPAAVGLVDKDYKAPSLFIRSILNHAINYKIFLALKHYSQKYHRENFKLVGPRVSLADYIHNMNEFKSHAEKEGVKVVYLTRPHRLPIREIVLKTNWRRRVPEYNQALLEFAKASESIVLDVQRYFEANHVESFFDECHFTGAGNEIMAEWIYQNLKTNNLLPLGE